MKNFLRASALTCATLCLAFGISTAPAKADDNPAMIRNAQMQLASLGYYVGRYDGTMGPLTAEAIVDFQRKNNLAATGQLNTDTYNHLLRAHDMAAHQMPLTAPVEWNGRWRYTHSQEVPIRYGNLTINEDNQGSMRGYAVMLNGKQLLLSSDKLGVLRASKTFNLKGEDAVIFTAYDGGGKCSAHHYLLTVHSDGTADKPQELSNCLNYYEANVMDNKLYISFSGIHIGSSTWDVWSYGPDGLARM